METALFVDRAYRLRDILMKESVTVKLSRALLLSKFEKLYKSSIFIDIYIFVGKFAIYPISWNRWFYTRVDVADLLSEISISVFP